MNTQTRIVNSLTAAVTLLVFAIGAGAFVLSYDALYATGLSNGIPAGKAWIWPLLIDAPLIVFTLALLVSQIMRQAVSLWAGLVILYTLATIGFNLSHALATPLGWTVAIVAPVGLLLTTEALRHLAKTIITRQAVTATLAELNGQVDTRRADLTALQNRIETDRAKTVELKTELARLRSEKKTEQFTAIGDDTRTRAIEILTERSDISGAELARLLGRSDTLARRLKRELLPAVNGHN